MTIVQFQNLDRTFLLWEYLMSSRIHSLLICICQGSSLWGKWKPAIARWLVACWTWWLVVLTSKMQGRRCRIRRLAWGRRCEPKLSIKRWFHRIQILLKCWINHYKIHILGWKGRIYQLLRRAIILSVLLFSFWPLNTSTCRSSSSPPTKTKVHKLVIKGKSLTSIPGHFLIRLFKIP